MWWTSCTVKWSARRKKNRQEYFGSSVQLMRCCHSSTSLLVFKAVLIGYEDNKRLSILKTELLRDDLSEVLTHILSNFFSQLLQRIMCFPNLGQQLIYYIFHYRARIISSSSESLMLHSTRLFPFRWVWTNIITCDKAV